MKRRIFIKIDGGYILLAKKILQSEIWLKKPAEWLKIWEYILINVNHKDKEPNPLFSKGQGFFSWSREKSYFPCITENQWQKCLIFLKRAGQIATQKATHGIIITVCNYETYQIPQNYKSKTESKSIGRTEAGQKQDRSKDIINEVNEVNEVNKNTFTTLPSEKKPAGKEKLKVISTDTDKLFDLFCRAFKEKFNEEYPANFGRDKKILKESAKLYGLEKVKGFMHSFFTIDNEWVKDKGYSVVIFKSQIPKLISGKYGSGSGAGIKAWLQEAIDKGEQIE